MRNFVYAAAAVAAVVVASGASATTIPIDSTTMSGGFTKTVNVAGGFNDTYEFFLSDSALLGATLSSANVSSKGGLTFDTVTFNGQALNKSTSGPNQFFSLEDFFVAPGAQTFVITGTGTGTYSGTVSFDLAGDDGNPQGVPEPASWAMMLGGFGMLGGALRRTRRTNVSFA